MNEAIIGLIGAAIGGLVSIFTAMVNNWHNGKIRREERAEQQRREDSATLLEVISSLDALDQSLQSLVPGKNVLSLDVVQDMPMIRARFDAAVLLRPRVYLLGSADLAETVDGMFYALKAIVAVLEHEDYNRASTMLSVYQLARESMLIAAQDVGLIPKSPSTRPEQQSEPTPTEPPTNPNHPTPAE